MMAMSSNAVELEVLASFQIQRCLLLLKLISWSLALFLTLADSGVDRIARASIGVEYKAE